MLREFYFLRMLPSHVIIFLLKIIFPVVKLFVPLFTLSTGKLRGKELDALFDFPMQFIHSICLTSDASGCDSYPG